MMLGHNSTGRDFKVRYIYLGAVMMAGLLLLAVNLYRLQIVRGEEFFAKSEDNRIKDIRVRAHRGLIQDRNGETLADARPSFNVFVTPAYCERCTTEVLPKLGWWLKWDPGQLARVTAQVRSARGPQRFQPMAVQLDLKRDELDVLNAHLFELGGGVDVTAVPHRNYRTGTLLAHVIGYMNEVTQEELDRLNSAGGRYALGDFIGRRGIERYLELRRCGDGSCGLRGVDGLRKEVVNARGELRGKVGEEVPPVPGNNVVLSIDLKLQEVADRAFPGTAGAVVVVDVRTGFVRVLFSRPSFDPNLLTGRVSAAQMEALARDPLEPMIFRPTAEHYHPGSTFKPVTLLAGLRSGSFNSNSHVFCSGGYRLGSRVWRCHKDSGHGSVTPHLAMKMSCDSFFYRVADTVGIDAIADVGRQLGLGAPTGLGVIAEVPGVMPDTAYHDRVTPGGYTKGMALNTAIGQGDSNVTPLQLALLYAAIANGGTLYQPQLIERIESPDGQTLETFEPKVVRQLQFDPGHHKLLVDALVAVVNEPGGTAYRTRLKELLVAGKTGTAQVARLGTKRVRTEEMSYFERDHAWFAAFAPADDPEIAVVVLNEHGGHGGSDAAPTAAAVIQAYFDQKRAAAERGPASTTPDGGSSAGEPDGEPEARRDAQKPPLAATVAAPAPAGGDR